MTRVAASVGGEMSSLRRGIVGENVRAKPAVVERMARARKVLMRRRRDRGGFGEEAGRGSVGRELRVSRVVFEGGAVSTCCCSCGIFGSGYVDRVSW